MIWGFSSVVEHLPFKEGVDGSTPSSLIYFFKSFIASLITVIILFIIILIFCNLKKKGLFPAKIGWQPELIIKDIDAIILGMHAKADNPELIRAQELGLKIYSFPEYIYHESRQKKRVVVGGSHGKTTTTAMIMHVLQRLQVDFDYLVGARLEGFAQSVNITNAPIIVCEGDEYPASALERKPKFHFLFPHVAILTGIAWDHINVFPTFDFYLEQFVIFIHKIEKGGLLIYNASDEVLKQLVEANKRDDIRYQPYGVPVHNIQHGKTTVTIEGVAGLLQPLILPVKSWG